MPEASYQFTLADVAAALPEQWQQTTTAHAAGDDGGGDLSVPNEQRAGWYFQQLLKLYAHVVVPGLSAHFVVLDADALLLRRTSFFLALPTTRHQTPAGGAPGTAANATQDIAATAPVAAVVYVPILTAGTEHNRPFFTHAQLLLGGGLGGSRHHPMLSGVVHHMPLVDVGS